MSLPPSFAAKGFTTPDKARLGGRKYRRLMIATEGPADTGKTEFALTAPGPGLLLAVDRGFDALYDNPKPPPTRRDDFGVFVMSFSAPTQEAKEIYLEQWRAFRTKAYEAIAIPEAKTVVVDGDSDTWDIQRLGEHGKLHGVFPQTKYSDVYAARRGFYYRLWDSGKIIIATNKVKDEYVDVVDPNTGIPVKDNQGEVLRKKTGYKVTQGFPDQNYLWQIRLLHLYNAAKQEWGIRILKAKADRSVEGLELWGSDCNFRSLVETIYPHIDPAEWGF